MGSSGRLNISVLGLKCDAEYDGDENLLSSSEELVSAKLVILGLLYDRSCDCRAVGSSGEMPCTRFGADCQPEDAFSVLIGFNGLLAGRGDLKTELGVPEEITLAPF
jgi:hypothetical protein